MKIEITGEAKELRSLHWNCKGRNRSTSPIRKRCQKSRCENLLTIWRAIILKMKNPTLLENVGNHVSNGVRNRSREISKGGILTAGLVCFFYSFVQFGFCLFDNGKDNLVIFRTLQRNHLLSVPIVPREWK